MSEAISPLLRLEKVSFAYPQGPDLLRDLDFSFSPGQRIGIIGPTGLGKTTFLQLLVGLLRPTRGRILFQGEPLTSSRLRQLRSRLGYVFQNPDDQLFSPTVLEDVAFGPLNLGCSPQRAKERAQQALDLVGLQGYEDRITLRLSGGEKKLLSLATILAMQPKALLLDEPSTGLDPETREHILQVIRDRLDLGLLIVSHDWDFLYQSTQELLTLEQGRLLAQNRDVLHQHLHYHPSGHVPHEHRNMLQEDPKAG
ncbi:MAG: ABC transporter ATP-binding protein [Desulfohalobiaceae bacterium]